MRNQNVCEIKGDPEKSIKNGDFRVIIKFPNVSILIDSLTFDNLKDINPDDEYPYTETALSFKSPFRIGRQFINIVNLSNDILIKNDKKWSFNEGKFIDALKAIIKKHKNTIIALPVCGALEQFKNVIIKALEDNVRDCKVIITEK